MTAHIIEGTDMNKPTLRLATIEDADAILAVYAPYVPTPVTFEETVPSTHEFRTRTAKTLETYPYLVAELNDKIVGFAYAHPLREREAYQWNAELSVYVSPSATKHGLGTKLYTALMSLIQAQGIKAAYGVVTAPNEASNHLHKTLGFERQYVQKNAGYTCGAWHDMQWYVKYLGGFGENPTPPIPFPQLQATQPQAVEDILRQANA